MMVHMSQTYESLGANVAHCSNIAKRILFSDAPPQQVIALLHSTVQLLQHETQVLIL